MTIDWDGIKTATTASLSAALAQAQSQAFAAFPMPAIPLESTYTWNGGDTVLTSDTSEVTAGDPGDYPAGEAPMIPPSYIRLDSDGAWYKVVYVAAGVSVTIQDTYGVGSFPTGSGPSSQSDGPVPAPPGSDQFEDKLATPIVNAIFDGLREALDQATIEDVASDLGNTVGPGVIY